MDNQSKNKGFIVIPSSTAHRLFKIGKSGVDAYTLYGFYFYTGIWQETKNPLAVRSYCKKGLGWGTDRFVKADKVLINEELIEKETKKDNKGRIIGHYVKLPFMSNPKSIRPVRGQVEKEVDNLESFVPEIKKSIRPETHRVDSRTPNTQCGDSLNTQCKDNMADATQSATISGDNLKSKTPQYKEYILDKNYKLEDFLSLSTVNPPLCDHVAFVTGCTPDEVNHKASQIANTLGFERSENPVGLLISELNKEYDDIPF